MRRDGCAIPRRVLDCHHQANGPSMACRKVVALQRVAAVLPLPIEDEPIDLNVDDLARTEETHVDGLAMVAGGYLQLRLPRRVRSRAQELSNDQLTGISERWWIGRIRLEHEVETNRGADRTQRVELGAGIAVFDAASRVR